MDKKFLIDTNIIIYYLKNEIPKNHVEKVEEVIRNSFQISTITKIELLGWKKITDEEVKRIETFLIPAKVLYVTEEVEQKAIEIKQFKNIKTPDAIIGATALLYNLTVVTRNKSDFDDIKGIGIYNPFEE